MTITKRQIKNSTMPTKDEKFPSKVRNEEPRNKGKANTKTKVKRQKNPSPTSKDDVNY